MCSPLSKDRKGWLDPVLSILELEKLEYKFGQFIKLPITFIIYIYIFPIII